LIIKLKRMFITFITFIMMLLLLIAVGCTGIPTPATPSTPAPTPKPAPQSVTPIELNVSAALSLTDALKTINDLYMQENKNVKIVANFASSGTLQKQIEQGAPADVFISAAAAQMDALQKQQLIVDETRKNLLNNKVVLIVLANSSLRLSSFNDLVSDKVAKIAIGDPKSVPAGTYGKEAFDMLGITEKLQPKLILGGDVRQVLAYVESGNVDAGIVYSTDAAISKSVKIVANAPDAVNAKIVYPVAVIKSSKVVDVSKTYMSFLFSNNAKTIFEKYGFSVVNK
jgi:molybdate transport system substrate-binding protein